MFVGADPGFCKKKRKKKGGGGGVSLKRALE